MDRANPFWNRWIFVLSIAGVFVAGFLWHAHATHGDIPCGGSTGCDEVAASPYAHFPVGTGPFVAAYGTIGFALIFVLSFLRSLDMTPARDRVLLSLIAGGAVAGTLFAAHLTYIELFVIYAICKWCVASQILILCIAVISTLELLSRYYHLVLPSPKSMKLTSETKMMIGLLSAVVVGGGLLAGMGKLTTIEATKDAPPPPPPGMTAAQIDDLFQKAHHQEGDASAALTIVEFGDFQCPSCRRAYNKTLVDKDKLMPSSRLAFYNLPLSMHQRAIPAAEAAEAAAKQNKFWPMYEALYATKSEGLDDGKIQAAAKTAGLDLLQFNADLKQPAPLKAVVDADLEVATEQHLDTTPTFYIHDKQGNTAVLAGAANLERLVPDLKDGIIGNDKISSGDSSDPPPAIDITVAGKKYSL